MKTVRITGERTCELIEVPDPKVKDEFCLIRITSAPMCTEVKDYAKGNISDCLGHEAAGEVVVSPHGAPVKRGERVVVMPLYPCGKCDFCLTGDYIFCQNSVDPLTCCDSETGMATYAQYCIKQNWMLIPIPEAIPVDHAAMACCGLGPAFGAMENMSVNAFDTVLVTGLGPVGLGAVINGVYRHAKVIGVEGNAYRANLAKKLGALAVVDPADLTALEQVKELTNGKGADKAIDCTAVPAAQKFAVDATRRRGHICFVGWGGRIEMGNMVPDGKILQGSWHWNLNHTQKMMKMIRECSDLIEQQITHRLPMSKVKDAWELQLTGECGKIILNPWE